MKKYRYKFLIVTVIFLISCKEEKNKNEPNIFFDKKTGELVIIDNQNLLKKIILKPKESLSRQELIIDSNTVVREISSFKEIYWEKDYKNTAVSLDYEGNFDFSESFFYETFLYKENNKLMVEITLQNPDYESGYQYILLGNLTKDYRFQGSVDTIPFNEAHEALFKIEKPKKGWGNLKFVICEDSKKGRLKNRRIIYANQKYYWE